jgi:SP family general alpha glucoside:H+ symporter-like MFS transporter
MQSHVNVENGVGQPAAHVTTFKGDQNLLKSAEDAANTNKAMSTRETFRVYRKAVLWSMILSTALVMEGYDVIIVCQEETTLLLTCSRLGVILVKQPS